MAPFEPSGLSPTPPIDVSVLVPVYNNVGTLHELLDRIVAAVEPMGVPFEIVLIDDGSRDGSFEVLERRAAADPRIRPFAMVRNFGSQAASVAALSKARGRRIVHIDADLENDPEDIPRLLAHLDQGADFVCAYRELRDSPLLSRRIPSKLMNLYVRQQTGIAIKDVGCGFRAVDARLVRDLDSEGEGRRLLTPILLRRARRVVEVPVRHRGRRATSGHSFITLLGIAVDFYMLTAKRPFLYAGLASAGSMALGLLLLLTGPRVVGVLLVGFGGVGGVTSLLGEYAQRLYQLGQGIPFYKLRDPAEFPQVGEAAPTAVPASPPPHSSPEPEPEPLPLPGRPS